MIQKNWIESILLGVLPMALFAGTERPAKSNVVLLLTDDLGWQDVKCYDIDAPSPMETPNIDALSKKGVLFWQAYSPAPVCAPSRCAIMSGNHPARAQKTSVVGGAPPAPINKNMRMMDPWYSGRMPANEMTLARVLKQNGYVTGHSGKWHMAIDHNSFPQPEDQGFDYTRHSRGSRNGMKDRLTGFATAVPDDPYRLDANGYPFDQTNEDALTFLRENQDKPFFLYYATWLVHVPIHTRSEAHLQKYAKKLGVDPAKPAPRGTPGQVNPFYCAMVEEMDYYVGIIFDYLAQTDDPRWPGHKLSENTYLIFTSDNGGMEGEPGESFTDNYPLDQGKIHTEEGGTRVPLIITGPGIPAGVQSDVMVNGLDFYPTILALTGSEKPADKHLDGCDLSALLLKNPTDPDLIREADGSVRDTMVWHFPHGGVLGSTIRIGDYKLIRNDDYVSNPRANEFELYRLYTTTNGKQVRCDIEEANDLAAARPEKVQAMNEKLTEILTEMKASYPFYNPDCIGPLPNKEKTPTVLSCQQNGNAVEFSYQENGAKVVRADLIYTLNGGTRYEEWFRTPATVLFGKKVSADLPEGTTHYYINLIDENNFMRSYPEVGKKEYSKTALKAGDSDSDGKLTRAEFEAMYSAQFEGRDVNHDGFMTIDEL